MNIIKNLIIRNKLRKTLRHVEEELYNSGYYEKDKQLSQYIRKPDQYAELYIQIQEQYGELLTQRNSITTKLRMLEGVNIFKKQDDEYTK